MSGIYAASNGKTDFTGNEDNLHQYLHRFSVQLQTYSSFSYALCFHDSLESIMLRHSSFIKTLYKMETLIKITK